MIFFILVYLLLSFEKRTSFQMNLDQNNIEYYHKENEVKKII